MFQENEWDEISRREGICNVFVENPSRDYYHPCRHEEYLEVLERLPSQQTKNVKGVILSRLRNVDKKFLKEARQ